MSDQLRDTSEFLTMVGHTTVIQVLVRNCHELVMHHYNDLSRMCSGTLPSVWDITINQLNASTISLGLTNTDPIQNITYAFPNDNSLKGFTCSNRSIESFECGNVYTVAPMLEKDTADDNPSFTIHDAIISKSHIDSNLVHMIDNRVLRVLVDFINRTDADNGMTSNLLLLATNLKRQFTVCMDFYMAICLPGIINTKGDVDVTDSLAMSLWVDQITRCLGEIPVGIVRFRNGTFHKVYVGINVATYVTPSPGYDHNRIDFQTGLPVLYVKD